MWCNETNRCKEEEEADGSYATLKHHIKAGSKVRLPAALINHMGLFSFRSHYYSILLQKGCESGLKSNCSWRQMWTEAQSRKLISTSAHVWEA